MYDTLSIIDVDETIFNTYSTIGVMKSGVRVRDLTNKEYNAYILKEGEIYDFDQFQDAKFFYETSKPIEKSVLWVQKLLASIEKNKGKNKHLALFLTARGIPDNCKLYHDKFELHNMKIRNTDIEFAYSGDMDRKKYPTTQIKKSRVIDWYLKIYPDIKTVRMFDDDVKNLKTCESVIKDYEKQRDKVINYFALHVLNDGSLQRI